VAENGFSHRFSAWNDDLNRSSFLGLFLIRRSLRQLAGDAAVPVSMEFHRAFAITSPAPSDRLKRAISMRFA